MQIHMTDFDGLLVFEPTVTEVNGDPVFECFNKEALVDCGIYDDFVQENQSMSARGVLRGLHTQCKKQYARLVRVSQGTAFDVAVDLRPHSGTYMKWFGTYLTGDNKKQVYIPKGFAHGFLALSNETLFHYYVTEHYDSSNETGIAWNDPELAIAWPYVTGHYQGNAGVTGYHFDGTEPLLIHAHDQKNMTYRELLNRHLISGGPIEEDNPSNACTKKVF